MAPLPEEASSAAQLLQPKWKGISSPCLTAFSPSTPLISPQVNRAQHNSSLCPVLLDQNTFSGVTHTTNTVLEDALVTTDKRQCLKY